MAFENEIGISDEKLKNNCFLIFIRYTNNVRVQPKKIKFPQDIFNKNEMNDIQVIKTV